MPKIYCPDCGKPNDYTSSKPNFCMNCGYSFNSNAKQAKSAVSEISPEDDEEISEINIDPDFELDVEIYTKDLKGRKIEDLVGTSDASMPTEPQQKRGRGRPKKVKNEDVWKEFKGEAGGSPRKQEN